jgi:hypothetical protein
LWSGDKHQSGVVGSLGTSHLAIRLDISELFVQGDSKIVIDWLRGKGRLQVITLECWKDIIIDLINLFQDITFQHVYREENIVADSLSKQALLKAPGKIEYYQCVGDHEGPHMFLDLF